MDSLVEEHDEALMDLSILKNGDIGSKRLSMMIKHYQVKTEKEKLKNKLEAKPAA
jgi:hypothetical protein